MAKRRGNERKRQFFIFYTTGPKKKQIRWPCLICQSCSFKDSTKHKNIPNASTNCEMTIKMCNYKFTISLIIFHSCELASGDDSHPKSTMSFDLMKFLANQMLIKCLHSIAWLKQNSGMSPEGQQLLVTTELMLRLTGLRPSKTRHSEHLVLAINQLLKRTDQDRWWATDSSGDTNAAGPSKWGLQFFPPHFDGQFIGWRINGIKTEE